MDLKKISLRATILGASALGLGALVLGSALAGGSHYFAPVTDAQVKEECGSCHLAFAPSMLPARSWQRMMGDLKNHFGDDASLDAQTAQAIADYLTQNAGDAAGRRYGGKLLGGVAPDSTPLRITELPAWQRKHRKVPDWEWRHKDVRSKAHCTACHADAERGYYDD